MTTRRAVELALPPSDWQLRELPARVVVFLHAVSSHAPLRATLKAGGYGPEDHAEGLRLLAVACPYRETGLDPADDEVPRAAAAELEGWARRHLKRLRVALERLHPEAALLVHEGPAPDGAEAVLAVATLLERARKLEQAQPKARALMTLAQRGFDRAERMRLLALVRDAQRAVVPRSGGASVVEAEPRVAPELVALYRWYADWAETARALVARKDWRIRMGLATRGRDPG